MWEKHDHFRIDQTDTYVLYVGRVVAAAHAANKSCIIEIVFPSIDGK